MASTKLTLVDNATYTYVLRSIENVVDGVTLTLADGPLFRVVCRSTVDGSFKTCELGPASDIPMAFASQVFTIENTGDPMYGAPDGLGTRSLMGASFTFGPFPDGSHLVVFWGATLLDTQPDRPRFSIWSIWAGVSDWSVFWQAPVLMQLDPLPQDRYFIGCNGGLVTEAPQVDLRGDGDAYRFAAAAQFEPEDNPSPVDRMGSFYPGPLGTDASAYGSRSTALSVLIHGNVSGIGSRVRDWFDGTSILLEHQVLAREGTTIINNGEVDLPTAIEAHRYVSVFKVAGEVFGEELGFNWRRWLLSSVEGRAILPSKARDRSDMARFTKYPLWLEFDIRDSEGETGITEQIATEYRLLFPAPWTTSLPRYQPNLLDFSQQDSSATHPGTIGDAVPDLFDLAADNPKRDYMNALRALWSMYTTARTRPRQPSPYDGNNYWDSYDGAGKSMDLARVKDSSESVLAGYKTTAQLLFFSGIVAAIEVSAGFTLVKVTGSFDKTHWEQFSTYALGAHASHGQHLGFVYIDHGGATWYAMERQNQAKFDLNYIAIAGDVSASISLADPIQLFFISDHFIPGFDNSGAGLISGYARNSLCSYADDVGANVDPVVSGPMVRFVERVGTLFAHYLALGSGDGLVLDGAQLNPVCWWDTHPTGYAHPRGGNEQVVGWNRVLANLRAAVNTAAHGPNWVQFEDDAPIDCQIGKTDGSSSTWRQMKLTTGAGSWGMSPFWITALGDYVRSGFYDNLSLGHVTAAATAAFYPLYESGGVSGFVRESILADWMHSRKLISVGHAAHVIGLMGTRPDGADAYTPFNNTDYGISNGASVAAMMARLVQAQIAFGNANFHGQRMRSLQRLGTGTEESKRGLAGFEDHDIGSHEQGGVRPYLMHCCFADPANRRRIVAVLANPSLAKRGDSFRFRPAKYRGLVPGHVGAYRVTKYVFDVDGWVTTDLGVRHGSFEITEQIETSEVVAYTFDFVSGLRFIYRYDDDNFTEMDMSPAQTHMRLAPLQGQGARFQFGFRNDHPDETFELAAINFRHFLVGGSRSR